MSLLDPMFITADGEPVTGRVNTEIQIMRGTLTPALLEQATEVYRDYTANRRLSVAPYHNRSVDFPDGSRVDCVTINNIDTVYVWARPSPTLGLLPHGLAVVVPWYRPFIFAKDKNQGWIIRGDLVPQLALPVVAYNGTEVKMLSSLAATPIVKWNERAWTQVFRKAPTSGSTLWVPINLRVVGEDAPRDRPPHYFVEDKLQNQSAAVLYTVAPTPNILLDQSDDITFYPGDMDTNGTVAVINARRSAAIASTVTKFRHLSEVLRRVDLNTYAQVSRVTADVLCTPVGNEAVTTLSGSFRYLTTKQGTEIRADVTENKYFSADIGFSYGWSITVEYNVNNRTEIWSYPGNLRGSAGVKLNNPGIPEYAKQRFAITAYTDIVEQEAAATSTIDTGFKLAGLLGAFAVTLEKQISYPAQEFFRAGYAECIWNYLDVYPPQFPPNYFYESQHTIERRNSEYELAAAPYIQVNLDWLQLKAFQGIAAAEVTGGFEEDRKIRFTNITADWAGGAITEPLAAQDTRYVPSAAYPRTTYSGFNFSEWYFANTDPRYYLDIRDAFTGTHYDTFKDARCVNTCTYTYTSRYIIDYDHRARFCAWIRVEVSCAGLVRDDIGSLKRGFLTTKTDPTYTVRIWFESNWNSVAYSRLLHESSATRTGFEFISSPRQNVYLYYKVGEPDWPLYPTIINTPPELGLREEVVENLSRLFSHQGVNENLAAEYVQPEAPSNLTSEPGLEYTRTMRDGYEQALLYYRKRFAGHLYARTFKLSDIPETLWLLTATKCNATQDNLGVGPDYYYMPSLKTYITTQVIHVELRDGLEATWTDEIPDPNSQRPLLNSRSDIKLYRV